MAYDIDSGGVLAVVAAVKQRTGGLGPVQAKLRHVRDELSGVLHGGPVHVALQLYGETVLMKGLWALAQRTANIFGGAQAAITAYVTGDEQMVATSLAHSGSVVAWSGLGFRVGRFCPVPVG
ncbi:DUF6507 family protein [Paenarthrobacter sp. NPDC056912]|uniref:DUF6507 family protein n=1 Tax=Paenarthrobacter sp. NPDC056912 TaxID=3345965 RepID=UPI00366CAC5C